MSTSNRTLLYEASIASLLVLITLALASPADFGVPSLGVHPAWLPITLFAARYGARGLFVALAVIVAPLLVAGVWLASSSAVMTARAHNPSDVLALVTAVAAAWIGMGHQHRVRRAVSRYESRQERLERAESTVGALSKAVDILRARCDRMDTSLTLWRSLSERFERGTPTEAAAAALELGALRCGATAGIVEHHRDDESAEIVARHGTWRVGHPRPITLAKDATARTALREAHTTCAADLDGASETDSDVAVPILDEADGSILGVLALRGVEPTALQMAELRDLGVIARWLAPQLARLSVKSRLRAVPEEGF